MVEDQDDGRPLGERLNVWEYARAYVSYRGYARLVNRVSYEEIDMTANPPLQLQLFNLTCHHIGVIERRHVIINAAVRNAFVTAFSIVLPQPESPDNPDTIHYQFLISSKVFRLITSSRFHEAINELTNVASYMYNECLCLIIEDIITGFGAVNAGNVAFNEQLERARDHIITEIIYAMGNTRLNFWGRIFLDLFERASGEPRTVVESDRCGGSKRSELKSVREQLIFAAEQGFNEAGRRGIAEEILRVAALREIELSQLIPLIKCAYESNGAMLFIRSIFERDERDAKLRIIDEVRELSKQLYFQAIGEGAEYAEFLGGLWEKESDFEVKQQLNRLVFQLKDINQEAAQRELEATRLQDRVRASSFSRRLPWMWS